MIIVAAAISLFIVRFLRFLHNATGVPWNEPGGKSAADHRMKSSNSSNFKRLPIREKRGLVASGTRDALACGAFMSSELDRSVLFDGQNRRFQRNWIIKG
jgi:hypothetical protein